MRLIIAFLCLMAASTAALAENAVFSLVRTVTAAELNQMLDQERAKFISGMTPGDGYELPPVSTAANGVEVYTVRYDSRIPEQDDKKITATGLLVLPVLKDRAHLPLISYQHGTVFGKQEVPSFSFDSGNASYDGAYETRYMAGLFAGNGYALFAADYFGMGGSAALPEAFFVKSSTQRASADLYWDVKAFLTSKGIEPGQLFLGGWSLGGLNTSGLLERLESDGVPVTATFTASAPSDPFAALSGLMFYPRAGLDAPWLNTIVAMTVFAYQNYYGPADLAATTLDPSVYDDMKAIYDRSYDGVEGFKAIMTRLGDRPLVNYLKPELRDPARFANSRYAALLRQAETYRQNFKSPLHMFYGSQDEVIKEMIGQLAAIYQGILIGNLSDQGQNLVAAQEVKGANHRLNFVAAAPAAKAWMDTLRK
ncbi:alpha/beta hydrolase family protein [Aestuariivirga sp.]|uniref:alpha/beta hydrolase family protein n=1 Tax=Aestuariivirga sp. TaxID=2650926 RepID=UPI003BAC6F4E